MADNQALVDARKVFTGAWNVFTIVQRARPTGNDVYDTTKVAEWLSADQSVRTSTKAYLVALIFEAFLDIGRRSRPGQTLDDTLANLSLGHCLTPTEATRLLRYGRILSGNDTLGWLLTDLMAKLAENDLSPSLVATVRTGRGDDIVLVQDDTAPIK